MTPDLCPHCGQSLPNQSGHLTERELDVLTSWWMTDSLKAAASDVGVGEQRAKNLLYRARIRNRVATNAQLLALHFARVRSRAVERTKHNLRREAA